MWAAHLSLRSALTAFALLAMGILLCGCDQRRAFESQKAAALRLPPTPPPADTLSNLTHGARLALVDSSLSPALLLSGNHRRLSLFVPAEGQAPVSPRYAAYGLLGPKVLTNGAPAVVTNIQERWILLWFSGHPAWPHQDAPLGLLLQHSPSRIELGPGGLHLDFPGPAGDVALLALYGSHGIAGSPADLAGTPRDHVAKVPKSWEWAGAVPRDPLTRIRYWSSALVRYPFAAWRLLEADPTDASSRVLHARFAWHGIPVDWQLPNLAVAPVSPELGEAWLAHPEEVILEPRGYDMLCPSASGAPRVLVGDLWSYSATIKSPAQSAGDPWAPTGWRAKAAGMASGPSLGQGWAEWSFAASNPIRSVGEGPALEWHGSNRTDRVAISLGEIRVDGASPGRGEVRDLMGNTRVKVWMGR